MKSAVAALLLLLCLSPARASEPPDDDILLAATFVTEGTLPATEIEASFAFVRSRSEREYDFSLSSLQYAWGNTFGLKLVVPFAAVDPRGEPGRAGPSDVQVLVKYVPILSVRDLFALATGVTLTLPTGSESRGLGGMFAIAPSLLAGKAWRLADAVVAVQTEVSYRWQLNEPARVAPDEPDGAPTFPDREQRLAANVTAGFTPIPWLTGILEVNSVTFLAGDPKLRDRVQVYVTPGIAVTPGAGWNVRAGVQVATTRARTHDTNVILLVTKGF